MTQTKHSPKYTVTLHKFDLQNNVFCDERTFYDFWTANEFLVRNKDTALNFKIDNILVWVR